MIRNVSADAVCSLCGDSSLAEVRGVDISGTVVYDVGCAPCPACEMGADRLRFDESGINRRGEGPPKWWKPRRWPGRPPSDFLDGTTADHLAQTQLVMEYTEQHRQLAGPEPKEGVEPERTWMPNHREHWRAPEG